MTIKYEDLSVGDILTAPSGKSYKVYSKIPSRREIAALNTLNMGYTGRIPEEVYSQYKLTHKAS